ncbi:MAG: hypothetical protein EKK37_07270 [Sphingobacteriales bacterium]|nr:MAG: hypothetical protein EKK37_07270 [Sphingobacteriales bacterium]
MRLNLTSFLVIIMTISCSNLFGQTVQSLTVVKLKNGSAIIECKKVKEGKDIFEKHESDVGEYWITSQTNASLQAGLKKAKSWAKLNKEHKMAFEKEIIRIRLTDKKIYEFYKKYISGFSKEAKLIFQGHQDGSFTLTLTITDDVVDITLNTEDGVDDFIKMLQGKSVNKEVDETFH